MGTGLAVDGKVDRVERLHRDPPVEWERTVWGVDEMDGECVLVEAAIIACPDCGEKAFWAQGEFACGNCDTRRRLVG